MLRDIGEGGQTSPTYLDYLVCRVAQDSACPNEGARRPLRASLITFIRSA